MTDALAGNDLDPLTIDAYGTDLSASLCDGLFHAFPSFWLNEENHATTTPCTTNFTGQRPVAARVFNDPIDGFRRNRGEISFAERPFLSHQAPGFLPVGLLEGQAHLLGDFGDSSETVLHSAVAADLCFEDFPVVDAVLARLAGVADRDAAFELIQI